MMADAFGAEAAKLEAEVEEAEATKFMAELRDEDAKDAPWTDARRGQVRRTLVQLLALRVPKVMEGSLVGPKAAIDVLQPLTLRVAFEVMSNQDRFWQAMLVRSRVWPTQSDNQPLHIACADCRSAYAAAHSAHILDTAVRLGVHLPWEIACLIARRLVEMRLTPS
jgi:hypothetical protein